MRIEEIVQSCSRHVDSHLTHMAADGGATRIAYPALAAAAQALAGKLAAAGLSQGHVVGIQAEAAIDWVVWDMAASHLCAVLRVYPAPHRFDPAVRIAEDGLALLVSDRPEHAGAPGVCGLAPAAFEPAMVDGSAPRALAPDLHSIVYSSGTTGREKVLMISRAGASAALEWFGDAFHLGPADRHVVFLPLSGFQQRQQIFACLHTGADVVLCSYQRVMQAIRQYPPTFLLAPPALYENILSVAQPGLPGAELPDLLGGAIRFMVTGMAPIRPRVMAAYWAAGLKLLEGYGLTECGIICCNTLDRHRVGTVGPLIDPDSLSLTEEGEIIVKQRYPLSLGYLGDDELNRSVHRADGAVMTGDVGHLDPDGFMILDGRVKDMIVLPSGKKLHPGDVEHLLLQLSGVEDAVAVDNGAGVTVVLRVSGEPSDKAIREGLRRMDSPIDAAGAVSQIIFSDIALNANPEFSTANMKLNRRLVARHFLGTGT
ncbi:MAG TPA: AMP-binding protein [Caulobacteraceae bacterium]|jgi:long-subunit acyl-CoA synthetase (AMP-forming)|nr:AMP-binding protein [Caulobacteraceae bacterium]